MAVHTPHHGRTCRACHPEGTPSADFWISGIARSLAFTALLERTDWFGRVSVAEGAGEISDLLAEWKQVNTSGGSVTLWDMAAGRRPRAERGQGGEQ